MLGLEGLTYRIIPFFERTGAGAAEAGNGIVGLQSTGQQSVLAEKKGVKGLTL